MAAPRCCKRRAIPTLGLQVPRSIIMPIIFVLCVVGRFSIAQRLFDVWTMLGVAVANWFLRRNGYHPVPFVLGDLMDKSLRCGLGSRTATCRPSSPNRSAPCSP